MKKHFEKIKSEGTCIHRLDEELIRRRRDELRCAPRENRKGWVKVKSKHVAQCSEDFDISCIPVFCLCVQARSGHPGAL